MKGFRLEGDNRGIGGSNSIWAFTPGELTKSGWMSDILPYLERLTQEYGDFDRELKHSAKNKMTIAVPNWVKNLEYKKGTTIESFWIKFFDSADVSANPTPSRTIAFSKVLILDNIDRGNSTIPGVSQASYKQVLMEIKNGVTYSR